MASAPSPILSPEQYLKIDSRAEQPSEYYDGVMYPVGATTFRHTQIQYRLANFLDQALRDASCEVGGRGVRVLLPNRRYAYPDVVAVCGGVEYEDKKYKTVVNPTLLVEVLSPSTGDFDRGGEADMCRAIPSLRDYLIIAQDHPRVQHFALRNGKWIWEELTEMDAVVHFESIGVRIRLAEIYDRIRFDPAE
jgi:Uma2 family endonuclease